MFKNFDFLTIRILKFQELARVEEEIETLRTVLASKTRHASDLKRKLGITVWKEITDDVNQGIKNVKESSVYVNFVYGICVV